MITLQDGISHKGPSVGLSMDQRSAFEKTWNDSSDVLSFHSSSFSHRKGAEDDTLLRQQMWRLAPQSVKCKKIDEYEEPSGRAPEPSKFQTIHGNFKPDPLLAVTPEKGNLLMPSGIKNCSKEKPLRESGKNDSRCVVEVTKRKPRVRFAPGTWTSPPSQDSCQDHLNCSDSSKDLTQSLDFQGQSVKEKLYQPGHYADTDDKDVCFSKSPGAQKDSAQASISENQADVTGCMEVSIDAGKPVSPKVLKHEYRNSYMARKSGEVTDIDAQVEEFLKGTANLKAKHCSKGHVERSGSASPVGNQILESQSSGSVSACIERKALSNTSIRSQSTFPIRGTHSTSGAPEYIVSKEPDRPQEVVSVVREAPYRPPVPDYMYPFNNSQEKEEYQYDSKFENPLAKPEFNSALKISENLKSFKSKQVDTWGEVSKRLQKRQNEIQEKASSRVNVQPKSGLFSDLVDIEVPLGDIRLAIEREKTLRATITKPTPLKAQQVREPDVMEFYSSDLQQELPDLTLTGIELVAENLVTASHILAFDLYRHNRVWEGLDDN